MNMYLNKEENETTAHMQLISTLSSKITEVYNNDFLSSHLKHDIICRLIAKNIGANSISILLYHGYKDDLYCAGKYIDPDESKANARIEHKANKEDMLIVLKYISAIEFIKTYHTNQDTDSLYKQYLKCSFSNPIPLDLDEFRSIISKNLKKIIKNYNQYKAHIQEDRYTISTNKSITGLFYHILTHYEDHNKWEGYLAKYKAELYRKRKLFICDLSQVPSKFITCCQSLKKKLKIDIDTDAYYIGIPLEVNDRPIGILRVLLKKDLNLKIPKFVKHQNTYVEEPQKIASSILEIKYNFNTNDDVYNYITETVNLHNIALLLSLHLNNAFYAHGMRQIALKPDLTKDFENKKVATELTTVVNCFGCIIRYSDKESDRPKIQGFSDSLLPYNKNLEQQKDPYIDDKTKEFKQVLINLFYPDHNIDNKNLSHKIESVKIELGKEKVKEISFQYFQENYKLISTTSWSGNKLKNYYKELRKIYNTNQEIFIRHDIQSIVIIPIKEKKYGFVTLANTSNRPFLTKDIEMIIPVVKRVGIELKYKNTIQSIDNRREEEFRHALRIIFHQLMSPVASMRNHILNIKDNVLTPEKHKRRIEELVDTYTNFLDMLASHRFFFDIVSKGNITPRNRSGNLFEFIKEKVRTYQLRAKVERGIEINIHEEKNKEEGRKYGFVSDLDLFSHIIQSLLDNAIKYSYNHLIHLKYSEKANFAPPNTPKHIYITLRNSSHEYEIKIQNWGCPIDPIETKKITDFFARGKNADKFDVNGSGIGLYVVDKIVNILNGQIFIYPKGDHTTIQLIFKHLAQQ